MGNQTSAIAYLSGETDKLPTTYTWSDATLLGNKMYPLKRRCNMAASLTVDDEFPVSEMVQLVQLLMDNDEDAVMYALCENNGMVRNIVRVIGSDALQTAMDTEFPSDVLNCHSMLQIHRAVGDVSNQRLSYALQQCYEWMDRGPLMDSISLLVWERMLPELIDWDKACKVIPYHTYNFKDLQELIIQHDLSFMFTYAATPSTIKRVQTCRAPSKCFATMHDE